MLEYLKYCVARMYACANSILVVSIYIYKERGNLIGFPGFPWPDLSSAFPNRFGSFLLLFSAGFGGAPQFGGTDRIP